jgi:glycosyltransferase involved in cell wall biosynthesis
MPQTITALPVYNELDHVAGAIAGALSYSSEVLVVDDGSTDGTSALLAARDDIRLITHEQNLGYGAALRSAFDFAVRGGYDVLVTIDCDGQHQPQLIPNFVDRCRDDGVDIVSGSRYLRRFPGDSDPPEQRRRINQLVTEELNRRFGLRLTDAFCGFKAYSVPALAKIELRETGYAMPLELWVRAVQLGLRIVELPVPLIYLDEKRSFGGALDDAETRLRVYWEVLDRAQTTVGWLAGGPFDGAREASLFSRQACGLLAHPPAFRENSDTPL